MTEKQLIQKAWIGDKDSFSELYTIYKDKLYRYAYYRLGNSTDAEDAVADCFVSAFKSIISLKSADAFSAWIFRILYCSCNKYIDDQVRNRNSIDFSSISNSYKISSQVQSKTEVMQALEYLDTDERNIVLLSVLGGLKSREIAKIMDMTAGSVRSKLSRSLAKMRTFLE